jgi:hypothetical protein
VTDFKLLSSDPPISRFRQGLLALTFGDRERSFSLLTIAVEDRERQNSSGSASNQGSIQFARTRFLRSLWNKFSRDGAQILELEWPNRATGQPRLIPGQKSASRG